MLATSDYSILSNSVQEENSDYSIVSNSVQEENRILKRIIKESLIKKYVGRVKFFIISKSSVCLNHFPH